MGISSLQASPVMVQAARDGLHTLLVAKRAMLPMHGGRVAPGLAFATVLRSALRAPSGGGLVARTGSVARDASAGDAKPAGPEEGKSKVHDEKEDELMMDAIVRQAAHMSPPPGVFLPGWSGPPSLAGTAAYVPAAARPAPVSLEEILPALVRRIAWSGDARRGSVRLELGAGALSGATLLVHAEDGHVRVALRAPPGTDIEEWRARIANRLAAKGLETATVDVR